MSNDQEKEELRIYVLMRTDFPVKVPAGKLMAQSGHAALSTFSESSNEDQTDYLENNQPKIVLRASLAEIDKAQKACADLGIVTSLITDAARNIFPTQTVTCLGIGPVRKSDLPRAVKSLRLYEKTPIEARVNELEDQLLRVKMGLVYLQSEANSQSASPDNHLRQIADAMKKIVDDIDTMNGSSNF